MHAYIFILFYHSCISVKGNAESKLLFIELLLFVSIRKVESSSGYCWCFTMILPSLSLKRLSDSLQLASFVAQILYCSKY